MKLEKYKRYQNKNETQNDPRWLTVGISVYITFEHHLSKFELTFKVNVQKSIDMSHKWSFLNSKMYLK